MDLLLVKPAVWKSKRRKAVVTALTDRGAQVLLGETEEDLREEISQSLKHGSEVRVISCGGDGTVHRALNSVQGLDVSLAVIPLGTGNDFARYLGLRSSASGVQAINDNFQETIDVGRVILADGVTRFFAGVASCGFDAQVNERANHLKGPEGTAKYLVSVFGELRALAARHWNLTLDEVNAQGQYTLVAVGNTSSYGGGMMICPAASFNDGVFDVTVVSDVNRRTLVRVLPRVFNGSHVRHPKVSTHRSKTVLLEGASFPVYADGERLGEGPVAIDLLPNAIRVVRPRQNLATP